MSALCSAILVVFWLSVLGMVFGSPQISQLSGYVFYLAAPLALIALLAEVLGKNDSSGYGP